MNTEEIVIFWHRRDLRLHDNHGLYKALLSGKKVLPVFIFDRNILDDLEDKDDQRVTFIHQCVTNLQEQLKGAGSSLKVFYSTPQEAFKTLLNEYTISAVYTNRDYEPYANGRDGQIEQLLSEHSIAFHTFKDQVIFEKDEVVKEDGDWYSVFSPYSKKWKSTVTDETYAPFPSWDKREAFLQTPAFSIPSLGEMGFEESHKPIPSKEVPLEVVDQYHETRDIPALKGTTRMSHHLRFGTVSIRELARIGAEKNEKWLNELIWRDFYMMILHFNPQVITKAFKPKYDNIPWRDDEEQFQRWCEGKTGYPIVDAGMRELNETGFMHNRVRMIVASFLTKHLLIDWRWGEGYFGRKLLDYELSSNNGGWQWAASSGCDAAPYFRVFNPELQTKKFDPKLKYVKKWVPEFESLKYQQLEIVEHKFARERVLKTFKEALG